MKYTIRFTMLLFAIVLLLGSCTLDIEATPTPAPTPTPTPTPEPSYNADGEIIPVAYYEGPDLVLVDTPVDAPFGLIQDTYYLDDNPTGITFGEIVGDTDVLMPTRLRITSDSRLYGEMEIEFDAAFPVAFTALQYTNGEVGSDGGIPTMNKGGYVEKYGADGSWTRTTIAQIRTPVPYVSLIAGETLPDTGESNIPTLKNDAVYVNLPLTEPGVYRYTLYFRESIDHREETLTTGEELYQLSMIVIIPMTDKLFDLIAVSDISESTIIEGEHTGKDGFYFSFLFRANLEDEDEARRRAPSQNMTQGGTLERKVGDEWVEVENAIHKWPPDENTGDVCTGGANIHNPLFAGNSSPIIYAPELAGEYRLTLILTNDYDENFEFVLYFDFDE